MELSKLLGARIRICIEAAGYRTVEDFAFAKGISKSTLSDITAGKKSPTVQTLARLANALKIRVGDFFEDARLDAWVREVPPSYFKNRSKTPKSAKTPPKALPKKPSRALKGPVTVAAAVEKARAKKRKPKGG